MLLLSRFDCNNRAELLLGLCVGGQRVLGPKARTERVECGNHARRKNTADNKHTRY